MKLHYFSRSGRTFLVEQFATEWRVGESARKKHELYQQMLLFGKDLMRTLFGLLLIGGAVTVALVAPNIFVVFNNIDKRNRVFIKKQNAQKLFSYFKRQRWISGDYHEQIRLTPRGQKRGLDLLQKTLTIKKTVVWDGKWWLVIFDIPRKHNNERNSLRRQLKQLGMKRLQDSVFVSRYPCQAEVEFLCRLLNISHYVRIARVDRMSGDIDA